jgi:hypothetical protein
MSDVETQEASMRKLSAVLTLPLLVLTGCGGQLDATATVEAAAVHAARVLPVVGHPRLFAAARSNNLVDHKGKVVPGLKFNLIFWGSGFEGSTKSLYSTFLKGLGSSGYWTIDSQYLRGAANHASFGAAVSDPSDPGTSVTDTDIQNEVSKILAAGQLPFSSSSLYFVVTPPQTQVCFDDGSGCSCTDFCGYHFDFDDGNFGNVLYSSIPSAAACPDACSSVFTSDANTPNGNVEADEGVSILAHEGEETQSDAQVSAWFDSSGAENGDKCAYNYGSTQTSGGAEFNQSWGGKNWLIQRNWSNAIGGCAQFGPNR